jgi:hypothetical protein
MASANLSITLNKAKLGNEINTLEEIYIKRTGMMARIFKRPAILQMPPRRLLEAINHATQVKNSTRLKLSTNI